METREELQLNNWMSADLDKKKNLLKSFEGYKNHDFKLKTIKTFFCDETNFVTGIYELDGYQYVFVPGSKVTLGWNGADKQDEYIMSAIQKELDIAGVSQNVDSFLKDVFSPLRESEIPPMLVERKVRNMRSENTNIVNYSEVIEIFKQQGFLILTEDEWEFLCGGTTKRIFSEQFDESFLLEMCSDKRPCWDIASLEKPNKYGLYIAYDPYIYELVNSPCYVKGGDGGGAMHGGYNILGILPLSSHYRDESIKELMYNEDFDCDVYARRIVKIE